MNHSSIQAASLTQMVAGAGTGTAMSGHYLVSTLKAAHPMVWDRGPTWGESVQP